LRRRYLALRGVDPLDRIPAGPFPIGAVDRIDLEAAPEEAEEPAVPSVRCIDFPDFLNGNIVIGASAAGGSTRDFPLLLSNLFGANFKIVTGYPGSNENLLAIEKGEVQGTCGVGWSTVSVQRSQWLRDGFIHVIAQEGMRSSPELDKKNVPLAYSFAKTRREQQVMQVHYEPLTFGRPFVAAAEVPTDRVESLQGAFMKAMNDPELRADAGRLRLDIAPASGNEVAAIVNKIYDLSPDVIAAARAAIVNK
jgi:hypothetical protein